VDEARQGRFREDLLYRLNVITILVPPLRDRKGDIPPLVEFFLQKKSKTKQPKQIDVGAMEALMRYDWPGNVRELEHVIERAIILSIGEVINEKDLHLTSNAGVESPSGLLSLTDVERQHIQKVLKLCSGNRKQTADTLGISQKTLYSKIKEYGLETQ